MKLTIDQQIAELQKQKETEEREQVRVEFELKFQVLKDKYEGKVFGFNYARKGSIAARIVHVKKVKLNRNGKIAADREEIHLTTYPWNQTTLQYQTYTASGYSGEFIGLQDSSVHNPNKEYELDLPTFKALRDTQIRFTQNFIDSMFKPSQILTQYTNAEYGKSKGIEETEGLLDIKHIMLEERETWLVSGSVFSNERCFLLTPASMEWMRKKFNEARKGEQFSTSLLHQYGYRNRNDRSEEYNKLQAKLETAYIN